MPADDRFMERLARIEHREKTGQKAEFAPLPEHPDDAKTVKRRSVTGTLFSWVIVPLVAATVFAGVFANELSGVLPPEFVTAANEVTGQVLSRIESATASGPVSGVDVAPIKPVESEVSRILLTQ